MPAHPLQSFVRGGWTVGVGDTRPLLSAIDGSVVATVPGEVASLSDAIDYARTRGGPALQKM